MNYSWSPNLPAPSFPVSAHGQAGDYNFLIGKRFLESLLARYISFAENIK
jgi:hypothetical protein